MVPKEEIAENDYDLSINKYKEIQYEAVDYDPRKRFSPASTTWRRKSKRGWRN